LPQAVKGLRSSIGPQLPIVALLSQAKRAELETIENQLKIRVLVKPVRASSLRGALMGTSERVLRGEPKTQVLPVEMGVRGRVLIAEDNVVNQKVAVRLLKKLGLTADVVNNGQEAVQAVAKSQYDCVLMDCQMPEMDGFQATAAIRAMDGPRARTLVFAMTANAMEGDRERCLVAGMDDYISKPVKLEEFAAMLTRWARRATPGPNAR
jgi:two-component system, sensor histidine kinase and response regulator